MDSVNKRIKAIVVKILGLTIPVINALRGPINKCEIRVIALQRSGHHAIISWIISQIRGRVVFLNKCEPGENPFITCVRYVSLPMNINLKFERRGCLSKKDCLIYNHESFSLEEIQSETFNKNHDRWIGRSLKKIDLLVLRDPFNLFASVLKECQRSEEYLQREICLWKTYANEYLRRSSVLSNPILVNYNKWFSDKSYRMNLSEKLGVDFDDSEIKVLSKWGSSFDQRTFEARADEMEVLERWKYFVNDKAYRNIFWMDKELVKLSNEIFGEIPGVDTLYSN